MRTKISVRYNWERKLFRNAKKDNARNQLKSSDFMNSQILHRKRPMILLGFTQDSCWEESTKQSRKNERKKAIKEMPAGKTVLSETS